VLPLPVTTVKLSKDDSGFLFSVWLYAICAPPPLSGNCCRADIVKSGQSAGNFLAEEEGRFQMPEHGTPLRKKKNIFFSQ
jgi:hypothetical protein